MLATHKKLAACGALIWGFLVFFTFGFSAKADTLPSQLLNDSLFSTVDYTTDFAQSISPIGYVATGTLATGIQLQFNNPNQTISTGIIVQINRWDSESDYLTCGFACQRQTVAQYTGNLVTDASGFAVFNFAAFTFRGFPNFYALTIIPDSPGIDPGYGSVHYILGTNTATGAVIYSQGGLTATTTGSQYYYQVFNGSSPTQFFSPSPNFAGFATSSLATTCDNSFATSTGFFDSVGSSISNGLCRVASFLFVPSGASVSQFTGLLQTAQTKIPFSYVYGLQTIFSGLTASSTANLTAVQLNFPDIASTTPFHGIVPSTIVVLSTTTIGTFMPESFRVGMLNLQRIALWLGLAYLFYRRVIPHHVMETAK